MSFDKDQSAFKALRAIVSERSHKLIVWSGAGLSAPAGIPSWNGLRQRLHDALISKAGSLADSDAKDLRASAQSISKFSNYWVAFEMLKKALGEATYQSTIRSALGGGNSKMPEAYLKMWKLPIAGLLNLNLDRLASRAFVDTRGGVLAEFSSRQVGAYTRLLNSPQPWVYNLHGTVEDSTSWVFTHEELKALTQDDAYQNFVRSVLSTSTVLMLGVTADDIAVGGHLEVLASQKIETGPHFWLTDRTDRTTDEWAEKARVLVIRYSSAGGEHAAMLEALQDLTSFVPTEDEPALPPVITATELPPAILPDPVELLQRDSETIRMLLNRQAAEILREDSPEAIESYNAFCSEYDEAIHRAWYAGTLPGRNKVLGYTLHAQVAQGAFGKVFRATSPQGDDVAVKILLDEIRNKPELLHSFRRGVQSMRILSDRKVRGMVPYLDATEIPAFVVMNWINGANLNDAVLARKLDQWSDLISTMRQLAEVLRNAHAVPERVLHRDLRPANVMIENVWEDIEWKVCVLDFDLSWHRGAYEQSVIYGSGTAGYLAPEQIQRTRGVSTRHSAVDSFGFGMTLYFALCKTNPIPDEHRHVDWEETVCRCAELRPCAHWRSIPTRMSRLVLNCTKDSQDERWDMSQIEGELARLLVAVNSPAKVADADLLAEEIASRCDSLGGYKWEPDRNAARVQLPSSLMIELRGDESRRELYLSFSRTTDGQADWKQLAKWIPTAVSSVNDILLAGGWKVEHSDFARDSLSLTASIQLDAASKNIDQTAALIDRAGRVLRYR